MDIEGIEQYIRLHSPIQKAGSDQQSGFLNETRPRDIEMLLTRAIDDQKHWAITFVRDLHFNCHMGTRTLEKILGIKRSTIRRILKVT